MVVVAAGEVMVVIPHMWEGEGAPTYRDVEAPDNHDEEHADEGAELEARGVRPHVGHREDDQLDPPLALLLLLLVAVRCLLHLHG